MSREIRAAASGRLAKSADRKSCAGLTLVELLVATCVAAVALTGAWAWLWTTGDAAARVAARAQAASAAAYALRCISEDLSLATSLTAVPTGVSPDRALAFEHLHDAAAPEAVLIVWDPARRVLWRKTPSTYLSDHVERFAIACFDADGRRLAAAELATGDGLRSVARVWVEIEVTVDGQAAWARGTVAFTAEVPA